MPHHVPSGVGAATSPDYVKSGLQVERGACGVLGKTGGSMDSYVRMAGCEIRILYDWSLGQCIIKTHWPVIDFTGPNYSNPNGNL